MKNMKLIYSIDRFGYADNQIYLIPAWDPTTIPNGLHAGFDSDLSRNWLGAEFWNTWKYFQNETLWDPSLSILFSDPGELPQAPAAAVAIAPDGTTAAARSDENLAIKIGVSTAIVAVVALVAVILLAVPSTRQKVFPWLHKRRAIKSVGHSDDLHTDADSLDNQTPIAPLVQPSQPQQHARPSPVPAPSAGDTRNGWVSAAPRQEIS